MRAVWYPASLRSFGKVTWELSNLALLSMCPFAWLCFPVRSAALLGAHIELQTKLLRKIIPSSAIRSRLGVLFITLPYALTAWYA